jgi:hypothetical protein
MTSLEKELSYGGALVTSWRPGDRAQLRELALQWQWQPQPHEGGSGAQPFPDEMSTSTKYSKNYCARSSIINFWRSGNGFTLPCKCEPCMCGDPLLGEQCKCYARAYANKPMPKGLLAFEFCQRLGVIVRRPGGRNKGTSSCCSSSNNSNSSSSSSSEDEWCVLFPSDLTPLSPTETFGALLGRLFPQLRQFASASTTPGSSVVIVKYHAHHRHTQHNPQHSSQNNPPTSFSSASSSTSSSASAWLEGPPGAPDASVYRTVGAIDSIASNILARLAEGPVFHDFILV